MAKHLGVILREKLIDIIEDYKRAISETFSNVESIRILNKGSGGRIHSQLNTVTNTIANLQDSLDQMTGFDQEGFLQITFDDSAKHLEEEVMNR